jgi:ribosome-binding protein aMBF1 (putative translation factor)
MPPREVLLKVCSYKDVIQLFLSYHVPKRKTSARLLFAKNLREARKARGISQEKLAELAGLHRTYIGSVERGERNITVDNMERLAHALGVAIQVLLEE